MKNLRMKNLRMEKSENENLRMKKSENGKSEANYNLVLSRSPKSRRRDLQVCISGKPKDQL